MARKEGKRNKLADMVTSIDLFSESIGFNIGNGKSAHGSFIGALFSLWIFICIILYGGNKLHRLRDFQDTKFSEILDKGGMQR